MRTILKLLAIILPLSFIPVLASAQVDPYLKQKQDQILRPSVSVEYGDMTGSGVVILSKEIGEENAKRIETYVLTNHHVVNVAIDDKQPVTVSWIQYDSKFREIGKLQRIASVVAHDENSDIALLRLHDSENIMPHVARIAPPGVRLQIMERMWTVGATYAAPPLASEGMLASMDVYIMNGRYMRTQMYINRGHSGGPLLHYHEDRGYELVGIVTALAARLVSDVKKRAADEKKDVQEGPKMVADGNISYSIPPEVMHDFLQKNGNDIGIDFLK